MTSLSSSEKGSICSAINRLVNLQLSAHFAYRYLGELCNGDQHVKHFGERLMSGAAKARENVNLIFGECLGGIGLDETESRLLFNFDLDRAERMDAEIKRSLEELNEMAKATGDPKLMDFAKKNLDNFGSGLDLKSQSREERETKDEEERGVATYPKVFSERVAIDKSTATHPDLPPIFSRCVYLSTPNPIQFNVEIQTDPLEEEEEEEEEEDEKRVEKGEHMHDKATMAHALGHNSPKIAQGPVPVPAPDKRDDDQSSTNTYDSVWDIPAEATGSPWRPAMNSTELLATTSETATKGERKESSTPSELNLSPENAAIMRKLELSIEEMFWEREESSNAGTHRGSDDGLQDDL